MGHEGVGYVEKVGANVKGFQKGDRIGFLYIKGCCCEYHTEGCIGRILMPPVECDGCLVHNLNCERGTASIQGFGCDGFFAEYAAVDYHNAIILPDSLDMETSAPYFCAGITGNSILTMLDSLAANFVPQHSTEWTPADSSPANGWPSSAVADLVKWAFNSPKPSDSRS